jgi:hypothetical protein
MNQYKRIPEQRQFELYIEDSNEYAICEADVVWYVFEDRSGNKVKHYVEDFEVEHLFISGILVEEVSQELKLRLMSELSLPAEIMSSIH